MTDLCPDFTSMAQKGELDARDTGDVLACFSDRLRRVARARCPDETRADDAVQDAVIALMEHIHQFRGDAPLMAWLRRLVISACSRLTRGRKNDHRAHVPYEDVEPLVPGTTTPLQDDHVAVARLLDHLDEALRELPEPIRALVELHDFEEVPLRELSERYGLSIDALKGRLKRARVVLRDKLEAASG